MTLSFPSSRRASSHFRAVSSNGRPIPDTAAYLTPAPDSTQLRGDDVALRERYQRDGFVVLRGVLDPAAVVELRGRYFASFPSGYLVEGSDPCEGRFSGNRPASLPNHGVEGHPAYAFVRSEPFARFVSSPALAAVGESLLDSPVTMLPRRILRHFDRSAPVASRAHADYRYLDGGSERVVTVWIPLGDVPLAAGGLVYQAGSHRGDPARLDVLRRVNDRPADDRHLSHDLAWVAEQLDNPWSWTDFRAGDVALHSPHVVHASLDTTTEAMRASADVRFLARGEQTDPRWLQPWSGDDGN
jgi:hypothetical protein